MTLCRVFDDAVFHAIERIAGLERRGFDGRQFARGNVGGRIGQGCLHIPNGGSQQMGPEVGGRSGDDAVIVRRKALSLHERLASAVRAGAEVRAAGRVTVEGVDDGLGLLGGFVNRAISEVDDLFRMVKGPGRVRSARVVAGIGGGGRVTVRHRARHPAKTDVTGETTIANALEFSVPAGVGHPHFELYVRIG